MRVLPSDLRAKIESALQTSANAADPKMEIFLGRTSDIITATERFLVRTIHSGAGLGSLALAAERPDPTQAPTRLWLIYVQNGVAEVATAPMPFGGGPNWTWQYTVGPAVDVAIEFDGVWDAVENSTYVYTNPPRSRFVHYTLGEPWLFRVTSAGELIAQQGPAGTPVTLAADSVTTVAAIRGWKSVVMPEHDQGLVVAYIRSGVVSYRNYAEQADGTVSWETEQAVVELPEGATSVSLFRTSDYRTGFLAEVDGTVYLAVTDRAWAGMAIGPERVSAAITDLAIDVYPVTYWDAGAPDEYLAAGITELLLAAYYVGTYSISGLSNPDGLSIVVELNQAVKNVAGQQTAWSVVDEDAVVWGVGATAAGSNSNQVILSLVDYNNATGALTVAYDGAVGGMRNEAGDLINSLSSSFTPVGLIPTFKPVPVVESVYNYDGAGLGLRIRFDRELTADPAGNQARFVVSFNSWDGAMLMPKTVAALSTQFDAVDQQVMQLNFSTTNRFSSASGPISVSYDGAGTLQGAGGPVLAFVEEFTPIGLLPVAAGQAAYLSASIAELQIAVNLVTYRSAYSSDHNLSAAIANLSVVVTKVGSNPL